jgi:hypothetical protein
LFRTKDMGELLKWAERASRIERFVKVRTAYLIFRTLRLTCLVVGCRNRDSDAPCSRCGAHGAASSTLAVGPGRG